MDFDCLDVLEMVGGVFEFLADLASDLSIGGGEDRRREEKVD